MDYIEFRRQLGKAGLTTGEFAELVKMSSNAVTNCSKKGVVPSHLAIIAALMAVMADNKLDFRAVFNEIEIEPKKPRGGASKGKFGGSKQIVLPME